MREEDEEYVDWFESDLHKEIAAATRPGDVVRIYRTNRGWSQSELTERLGIPKHHVSNMERGLRSVSASMAIKLARLFDVVVERFLAKSRGGLNRPKR